MNSYLWSTVLPEVLKTSLDPGLVRGVISVESGWDTWATRYEKKYRWLWPGYNQVVAPAGVSHDTEVMQQMTSWGLMQVMGAVAREMGFRERFISRLCNPIVGVRYGCKYLEHMKEKRGWDGEDLISAYNAGRPTKDNADYVRKVMKNYEGSNWETTA